MIEYCGSLGQDLGGLNGRAVVAFLKLVPFACKCDSCKSRYSKIVADEWVPVYRADHLIQLLDFMSMFGMYNIDFDGDLHIVKICDGIHSWAGNGVSMNQAVCNAFVAFAESFLNDAEQNERKSS